MVRVNQALSHAVPFCWTRLGEKALGTCAADVLAVERLHGKEQVAGHSKCANLIGKLTLRRS